MSIYLRKKAVEYAMRYALIPNPNYKYFQVHEGVGGDCTNFTSQCLKAGGAPLVYDSINPWWYNNKNSNVCWTLSWTVAHSLYWCLIINSECNLNGPKGIETENLDELEIGDLIFYEDINGLIYHSAIITSFFCDEPLISQHTFNALNIPYPKPYRAVKNHFLKIYM